MAIIVLHYLNNIITDFTTMNVLREFIKYAKERFSDSSYSMLKLALREAIARSTSQNRYDGSPFVYHPIAVALIVSKEIGLGSITTTSALIHDIVRSGAMSLEEVEEKFGSDCRQVVKAMNDISTIETKPQMEQVEHFQELIVSYSVNPRIILLKLADRLEVTRSLEIFPNEKKLKKSWESLNIYAPIAHKLGLYNIKSELEDTSLKYLETKSYLHIKEQLEKTAAAREDFISEFTAPLRKRMEDIGIKFSIKGRTKSIYSIWRKMKKQKVAFDEIFDVFAIRIVIDCPKEQEKSICWNVYSIVTEFNIPNPNRMRDWISVPKSTGYESLHATVVTESGRWVEIQIRSLRMDDEAERGIAAHWRYKGVSESGKESYLKQLRSTIEQISIGANGTSPDLSATFEGNDKEILVFTPNGDLRKLPLGATILDFAFDIHSALGNNCVGGKVNHKNVTIREKLNNGDLVSITTSKNQKPKLGWLDIVVTSKAKNRIKAFLRDEEAKMANLGKEELERKIKNWKLNVSIDEAISQLTRYYKKRNGKEFLEMIFEERVTMAEIKELLQRHISGENILRTTEERAPVKEKKGKIGKNDAIIIGTNQRGLDYKLAKCCNPVFGDEIFSFAGITNGFTIHRTDCVNAAHLRERFAYRILPARWNDHQGEGAFITKISLTSDDVMGIEHSIRDALRELSVNLRGMNVSYEKDAIKALITVEVAGISYLDTVIYRLLRIKGMKKVVRI
ncbi:MAG: HD domain-containing protein [Rikenellaceae bacterium]